VDGSLERDRRAGVRVVVQRLAEGDAEEEEDQRDADPDPPPDQLLPAATTASVLTLNRTERRHGV
jgi:hypothetical protein